MYICIYVFIHARSILGNVRHHAGVSRAQLRAARKVLTGTHGYAVPAHEGAWLRMRRRRTGAQLLRVGVRGASRMSVQVDAAADVEPDTAGRQGRSVQTASVRLAADGRQALARPLGCDLRIALRAGPVVERADERCAQRGPAWLWTWRHDAL